MYKNWYTNERAQAMETFPDSLADSVEKQQQMMATAIIIDYMCDSLVWAIEVAELPGESRCSHAELLLETDSRQPSCSGAER